MADTTDFLAEWTGGSSCLGDFQPYAEYGAEEDALIFFFRPDPYFRKRINSRVTVYVSENDGELVGCQVKSVRHVLDDIDAFDVNIEHGKVSLTLLFAAMRGDFVKDDDGECGKAAFKRIGRAARESQLLLDV